MRYVFLNRYGIHMNRLNEETFNHHMYNWQYWDKRNRLTHNMIMEHFEIHKEELEDLIIDMNQQGPKVFMDIPVRSYDPMISINDFAIIDELSGLTAFVDKFMIEHDVPETVKLRIEAHMFRYQGEEPKEVALNKMKNKLFGNQR